MGLLSLIPDSTSTRQHISKDKLRSCTLGVKGVCWVRKESGRSFEPKRGESCAWDVTSKRAQDFNYSTLITCCSIFFARVCTSKHLEVFSDSDNLLTILFIASNLLESGKRLLFVFIFKKEGGRRVSNFSDLKN